ncbi:MULTISPECIES: hypothetical protein [Bacteroidota]|uniref:hypothetical protein n=1 Tax=Bacteroidota TaxID=976 RepID=UPI001CBCFEE7|nr:MULTISPECIES: hypothetical protein [Bacteroidota]MBZ4190817.1 hypothetical protein [Niabella beijingensis]UMQ40792.1 hypothetical protein MKS83_15485 [Chryseobacterium sp. Y16C]
MGKPYTPERLASIRRMRKARRLYKKEPLFAYDILSKEHPSYTPDDFWEDLRYRTKPKRRKAKSPLIRYGRFRRMEQLNEMYRATENTDYALKAQQLRRNMTKPYRMLLKVEGKVWEYSFSALIRIEEIERLSKELSGCKTLNDVEAHIEQFRKTAHIG